MLGGAWAFRGMNLHNTGECLFSDDALQTSRPGIDHAGLFQDPAGAGNF
jgi:hypothetical protein